MIKMTDIVPQGAIVHQVRSATREEVVVELIDALIAAGGADAAIRDDLVKRVLDREKKGSTGFGRGVAVPHVKHPSVKRMVAAIGLSSRGIDFASLDRQPVFSVVLLMSPEGKPEEHLQAMEIIFKNLSKETFRRFLRQAQSVDDVRGLLEEADQQHLIG